MASVGGPVGPAQPCTVFYGESNAVARSIAAALRSSGRWAVRVADPLLYNRAHALSAVSGASAVFLVDPTLASRPVPKDLYALHRLVVGSARTVVAACREAGVRTLVYTGSADVVFDGVHAIHGGDESAPYPEKYVDVLNELRAQAERLVLFANGKDGLSTCALRTSNPFGPGESDIVPFLVHKARSFKAKFIIGSGENVCDFTYMENVAQANICAEQALCSDLVSVAGKPFFITNHEPVKMWDFFSDILEGLGYERPRIRLPINLLLLAVVLVEQLFRKLGLLSILDPYLTPAMVSNLSRTRTFNGSKAQSLIGYSPIVPLEDGVKLTVESFSHLANDSLHSRRRNYLRSSKAEEILGSGRVADILLWRNEKKTFTYVTAFFLLYYWFLLSGQTFISSIAKLLLVVSVILFIRGTLPSRFWFNIDKVSSSYYEDSDLTLKHLLISMASIWNNFLSELKLLAQGDDWDAFFKAAGKLYLLTFLLSFPPSVLIGIGFVFMFTIFIVFEQYEDEILKLRAVSCAGLKKVKELVIAKLPSFFLSFKQASFQGKTAGSLGAEAKIVFDLKDIGFLHDALQLYNKSQSQVSCIQGGKIVD